MTRYCTYKWIHMSQNTIRFSHKSWKRNPMRQQYFLCHLFRKMNQYCISVCGKVCESLELAVNLKVKLESHLFRGVFNQCNDYQMSEHALFYSKSDHICGSVSWHKQEITEDLRKRVGVAHQARKGYKTISKEFGFHKFTVRQIVYKWRKFKTTVIFTRNGRPTKSTPKQDM